MNIFGKWTLEIENTVRYDSFTGKKIESNNYWIKQGEDFIAIVSGISYQRKSRDEIGALMSQAPDLLESLEAMVDLFMVGKTHKPDAVKKAEIAIAKAKGEYFEETPLIEAEDPEEAAV